MLQNFFKATLRSLWKNRTYSFLNIFGLATGIACAGLIFLWVENETGYDQSYPNKEHLYHVRTNQTYDGVIRTFGSTPVQLAEAIRTEIPGIANTCRIQRMQSLFSVGEKSINERGCYADPSVFSMFQPSFLQGNSATAFNNLHAVVISERMAERFFGAETNVIGRQIRFENKDNYIVSGVVKNAPENSTPARPGRSSVYRTLQR